MRESDPTAPARPKSAYFGESERIPSNENVAAAKRLLLDAAENWHIAEDTDAEQRVKAWEKNVKTEAEFLASFPDQPSAPLHDYSGS
jgi:hypothetical protein